MAIILQEMYRLCYDVLMSSNLDWKTSMKFLLRLPISFYNPLTYIRFSQHFQRTCSTLLTIMATLVYEIKKSAARRVFSTVQHEGAVFFCSNFAKSPQHEILFWGRSQLHLYCSLVHEDKLPSHHVVLSHHPEQALAETILQRKTCTLCLFAVAVDTHTDISRNTSSISDIQTHCVVLPEDRSMSLTSS